MLGSKIDLGNKINIPAFIGNDFPRDEWVKFEAFIKVNSDGTVMTTRQTATKTHQVHGKQVDWS